MGCLHTFSHVLDINDTLVLYNFSPTQQIFAFKLEFLKKILIFKTSLMVNFTQITHKTYKIEAFHPDNDTPL